MAFWVCDETNTSCQFQIIEQLLCRLIVTVHTAYDRGGGGSCGR